MRKERLLLVMILAVRDATAVVLWFQLIVTGKDAQLLLLVTRPFLLPISFFSILYNDNIFTEIPICVQCQALRRTLYAKLRERSDFSLFIFHVS